MTEGSSRLTALRNVSEGKDLKVKIWWWASLKGRIFRFCLIVLCVVSFLFLKGKSLRSKAGGGCFLRERYFHVVCCFHLFVSFRDFVSDPLFFILFVVSIYLCLFVFSLFPIIIMISSIFLIRYS